jgi:signal transduction histidine kinase
MREVAVSIGQEINKTLAAIVDNADRSLRSLDENKSNFEAIRQALTNISADGRRTIEIIARIRALAKPSAPQKVTLNLNHLAREVLDLIAQEAQRKRITLQTKLAADLPSVPGDPVQLQQVMLNLVMNSLEAMNGISDHTLELTVKTAAAEKGEVMVAVTDRGTGINPQEIERVFKAFHTTKNVGMGMGLAISRSIIEAHGGRLWAEPNIGPGTTFKFTLPAGAPNKGTSHPA